jgi:hypothetical protein
VNDNKEVNQRDEEKEEKSKEKRIDYNDKGGILNDYSRK